MAWSTLGCGQQEASNFCLPPPHFVMPLHAGGDGVVNFWDGENKKRLAQVVGYPTSVAALAFNGAATQLAVASSYTFEQASVVVAMLAVLAGWQSCGAWGLEPQVQRCGVVDAACSPFCPTCSH